MMYIYLQQPEGAPVSVWGAVVAVPEQLCLTYAAEVVPHLRPGTTLKVYTINPATGYAMYEWVFICT